MQQSTSTQAAENLSNVIIERMASEGWFRQETGERCACWGVAIEDGSGAGCTLGRRRVGCFGCLATAGVCHSLAVDLPCCIKKQGTYTLGLVPCFGWVIRDI